MEIYLQTNLFSLAPCVVVLEATSATQQILIDESDTVRSINQIRVWLNLFFIYIFA